MARAYGKIKSEVWLPSNDYRLLTWRAQWLYQAITSQGSITPAGVLSLQPTKWARFATDITLGAVMEALQELVDKRYVLIDHDTEELLVRTFIRHDAAIKNPKMVQAVRAAVPRIESATLRAVAADAVQSTFDQQMDVNQGAAPVDIPPDEKPQVDRRLIDDRTATERRPILTAASSKQLTPNNKQQQPATAVNPPMLAATAAAGSAAAALDLFIQHRLRTVGPHNPGGFERSLRGSEPTPARTAKLNRYLDSNPAATAIEIAENVYDLGPIDLIALGHTPTRSTP